MVRHTSIILIAIVSFSVFADFITNAVQSDVRASEHKIRDEYRHPQQTLRFFGLKDDMSVVEIWPGGGWYADILAPALKDKGMYYAAHFYVDENAPEFFVNSRSRFAEKISVVPEHEETKLTSFHPIKDHDIAPEGTVDMVLTFRNVHNWYMRDGEEGIKGSFAAFYKALRKGGVLGVVEHRLPEGMPDEAQKRTGYMKQSFVINKAKEAGFKLVATSEINANPNDSADHPNGVWTLPPRLRVQDEDPQKYIDIGESDRMTLKFIKP